MKVFLKQRYSDEAFESMLVRPTTKFEKMALKILKSDLLVGDWAEFHPELLGEEQCRKYAEALGYPVEVSDNMDEIATGKTVAYFGDFSGVALKQKSNDIEINVLREIFATQHATGINAKVEDYNKIVKLVCK